MRRRRLILGAGALSVAGLTAGAANLGVAASDDDSDDPTSVSFSTESVSRRDLEQRTEVGGTLGYGEVREVPYDTGGTVTSLPPVGTVVDRGQTLAEVDGHAVPLLLGDRPMWRDLGPGVSDGADVEEIEANLVALGFDPSGGVTVDRRWTAATTRAVKAWQGTLGREKTGMVVRGDAVVLPTAVRIAGHPTPVGEAASGPVVEASGPTRLVTVDLEATKRGAFPVDQPVEVDLPDGTTVDGHVAAIDQPAPAGNGEEAADAGGEPRVEVTVAIAGANTGAWADEAPVVVRVVTSRAEDVLAVPVDALLALAEGGFAVERVESGRQTRLVPVELGDFADGWVAVTSGDLAEGDDVVVPE